MGIPWKALIQLLEDLLQLRQQHPSKRSQRSYCCKRLMVLPNDTATTMGDCSALSLSCRYSCVKHTKQETRNTVGFNVIRTGKILFLAQNSVQTSYANSTADITHIKSVLFSSAVIFFGLH